MKRIIFAIVAVLLSWGASAAIVLPKVLGSNMVLQQNCEINLWGKADANKKVTYEGRYHIKVCSDFAGENLSIYLNDSLLTTGIMPDTLLTIDINRFAEENALIVVDNATDNATPFNLDKKGSKILIQKSEDGIVFEETPARF